MHRRRLAHGLIDEVVDAPGAAVNADVQRGCELFHRPLGRILRDLERASDKGFDAHIAEQDVGIGDRRLRAAALVGGRSREGAGRARTDIEKTKRISFAAMDPPPAPISIIWIDWILSGKPDPLRKRW